MNKANKHTQCATRTTCAPDNYYHNNKYDTHSHMETKTHGLLKTSNTLPFGDNACCRGDTEAEA